MNLTSSNSLTTAHPPSHPPSTMKTFLLFCLVSLASPAPQWWRPTNIGSGIINVGSGLTSGAIDYTYGLGSGILGGVQNQAQQTIGFAGQQTQGGLNFVSNGLQGASTFGANTLTNGLNLASLPFRPFWG